MFLLSIMLVFVGVICIDHGCAYLGPTLSRALIVLSGLAILGIGGWIMVACLTL